MHGEAEEDNSVEWSPWKRVPNLSWTVGQEGDIIVCHSENRKKVHLPSPSSQATSERPSVFAAGQ